MSLQSIINVVWSRYGLIGVVVVAALLVGIDQLYDIGLADLLRGLLGS